MPRNACGSAKKRLKNGYAIAIASAANDSRIVVRLVARTTSANPRSANTAETASASHGAISPRASGRSAVRFTCASNCRSAQSLNAQPAQRMMIVPNVNTTTSVRLGSPSAAIHSADSVGHNSNRMPIGLSRRTSRSYASRRCTSESCACASGRSLVSFTMRAEAVFSTPAARPRPAGRAASDRRAGRAARASSACS